MWKRHTKFLLTNLLFLFASLFSACTYAIPAEGEKAIAEPSSQPTISEIAGSTPIPASSTPNRTTRTPTDPPQVTDTPTGQALSWSPGIFPIQEIGYSNGNPEVPRWSAAANELMVGCNLEQSSIFLASAPDFRTRILSKDSSCWKTAWSEDGKVIAYIDRENGIMLMDRDGSNTRSMLPDKTLRLPGDIVFIDNSTIMYSSYSGGSHSTFSLLDTSSGSERYIASIPGGELAPFYDGFLPVTSEIGINELRLIVISEQFPVSNTAVPLSPADGRYKIFPTYNSIPGEEAWTAFNGWMPGTHQMLVSWKQYERTSMEVQKEQLLLWDVKTGHVAIAAPDSTNGLLSPDGRYLAYQTRGPSFLDAQSFPIEAKEPDPFSLYGPFPEIPSYLQLMDLSSRKVILSIPSEEMNFSPDGKYFAFRTFLANSQVFQPGDIKLAKGNSFHLFDPQQKKIILSLSNAANLPVWSPTGKRFLYYDEAGNIWAYTLSSEQPTRIGQVAGEWRIREMRWSYNEQYFFINYSDRDENEDQGIIAVVETP